MKISPDSRTRLWRGGILSLATVLIGLALAGCGTVDKVLFGEDDTSAASSAPAPAVDTSTTAPSPPRPTFDSASNDEQAAASQYSQSPAQAAPPPTISSPPVQSPAPRAVAGITPVPIDPGSNTGTSVNTTVQQLRGQLSNLEQQLSSDAQRLADLRNATASSTAAYLDAKTRITTRLQLGTTRANPELVAQWNSGQSALDQLSANINALTALGRNVNSSVATAQSTLSAIGSALNAPGAVDEDHRQLGTLEDETNQTIILLARLQKDLTDEIRRETGFVANERVSLAALATGIKIGEVGAPDAGPPSNSVTRPAEDTSGALYVVHFNRKADYQRPLYAALNKALQSNPAANFEIVAVSPTRGSAASIQSAQTSARRHAQDVVHAATEMGVPATRISLSSSTDPSVTSAEVRIFVR